MLTRSIISARLRNFRLPNVSISSRSLFLACSQRNPRGQSAARNMIPPCSPISRHLLCPTQRALIRSLSTAGGISLRSSGVIFDPYKISLKSEEPSVASIEGMQARLKTAKSVLKSSYSSAFIQRHIKSFNHRTFPTLAEGVFTKFTDAHRSADIAALRAVVTEGLLEGLKQELRAHQKAAEPKKKKQGRGNSAQKRNERNPVRSAFSVKGFSRPSSILQMRHGFVMGQARSANTGFGQVTVMVHSQRRVVAVDASGNVLAEPSGARVVEVPSVIVLEVGFGDQNANWRIARIEEVGSRNDGPKQESDKPEEK